MKKHFWLYLAFFLSGATSLVLEITWSKELSYILGNSLYSSATVVAAFMCGLSLGSWLLPKISWALQKPLRTYGLLQIAIGLLGLISIPVFRSTTPLFAWVYGMSTESPLLFLAIRFLITFTMMVLPVLFMGMTLPAVVGSLAQKGGESSSLAGRLYGVNTIGALVGTLLAGFFFIPNWGLLRTCIGVGIFDLLIGYWAIMIGPQTLKLEPIQTGRKISEGNSSLKTRGFELLFFVSGGLSIVFELSWFRMLSGILGATVHAFTNMLVIFLLGIGLGSVAGSALLKRSKNWRVEVFFIQAMIGICALVTLSFYDDLPYWYGHLYLTLSGGESGFGYILSQLLISALIVLPSTFFMGAFFPYALHLYQELRASDCLSISTGRIYAFNTIGGVIGSLLTGFFLIPSLGVSSTISLASITGWLVAAAFLFFLIPGNDSRVKLKYFSLVSFLTFVCVLVVPPHDPLATNQGIYMSMATEGALEELEKQRENTPARLLYYKDGVHGSVAVTANEFSTGKIGLRISGKPVAGAGHGDRRHLMLLGQVPLLLHENPKTVAVVGLGTGITAGHVLSHQSVESVEILELEKSIVEASHYFNHVNGQPLADPRTKVIFEDGRIYLKYTNKKYDVITSDPISPLVSGAGNLYSREYYMEAAKKLNEGGVFCQWIQNEGLSENSYKMALKAIQEAFPYTYLFIYGYDSVAVGSNHPISLNWNRLERVYQSPSVQKMLASEGLTSIYDFFGYFYGGKDQIKAFLKQSSIPNTDDNVKLEHNIPFDFYSKNRESVSQSLMIETSVGRLEAFKEMIPGADPIQFLAHVIKYPPIFFSEVHEPIFTALKASAEKMKLPIESATLNQWQAVRLKKEDIAVEYEKLNRSVKEAMGEKDKNRLMGLLETALSFRHGTGYYTAGILLGEILIEKAQFAKVIEVSQKIKLDHPAYPEAYRLESEAYIQTNQLALAKATLAEGLIYSPDDPGLNNLHKSIPIQ